MKKRIFTMALMLTTIVSVLASSGGHNDLKSKFITVEHTYTLVSEAKIDNSFKSDAMTALRNQQQNLMATCTLYKKMIRSATKQEKNHLEQQLELVEQQLEKINKEFRDH